VKSLILLLISVAIFFAFDNTVPWYVTWIQAIVAISILVYVPLRTMLKMRVHSELPHYKILEQSDEPRHS